MFVCVCVIEKDRQNFMKILNMIPSLTNQSKHYITLYTLKIIRMNRVSVYT